MVSKTNAVRLAEQAGIPCRECFYEFDKKDLNGNRASAAIGMPPEPEDTRWSFLRWSSSGWWALNSLI